MAQEKLSYSGIGPNKSKALFWPLLLSSQETALELQQAGNTFFQTITSLDQLAQSAEKALHAGIGGIVLYERPSEKSEDAAISLSTESRLIEALQFLSSGYPELCTVTDLCVCQYTTDGHCRLSVNNQFSDDATIKHLLSLATHYAEAGTTALMPSAMLPYCSQQIKAHFSYQKIPSPKIFSQSAKFESPLYTPFRDSLAMNVVVNKKEYQLSPSHIESALSCISAETEDGADLVLIKPAIPYFSELRELQENFHVPCGAFITSGEHALLLSLGEKEKDRYFYLRNAIAGLFEQGAESIVTYVAPEIYTDG